MRLKIKFGMGFPYSFTVLRIPETEKVLLCVEYVKELNRSNPANNQINGIAWYKPEYDIYIRAAMLFLSENETYVGL